MMYRHFKFVLFLFILILPLESAWAWKTQLTQALKNGGALVVDDQGQVLFSHRPTEHFIPASTIKVATAAAAIDTLGRNHRFKTEFYLTPKNELYVKGYGDPFLVSEEFPRIIKGLKDKGLKEVRGIILDNTFFDKGIVVDGASRSTNPYDALNGALIANFNTIYVLKTKGGSIQSAEPQTPMTPIAYERAQKLGFGKQRVNLGKNPDVGARYFGELLAEFMKKEDVFVSREIKLGIVPESLSPFYTHRSSKTLDENLKGLLEFSTNFIANQLFLVLGAQKFGAPATVEKGEKVLKSFLNEKLGWKNFEIKEGAGLSRQNQVTPKQMILLLKYFEPYKNLMPLKDKLFLAKTGTLTGVNTYVGYFPLQGHTIYFSLLVNSPVAYGYKFKLAKMLYQGLSKTYKSTP